MWVNIAHMGSHSMHVHPILDKIIFPIYFDGTSKQDYRDAIYVLNNANCITIGELQSISENEREKSYKGDRGFSYRIPVMAKVSIEVNNDLKSSGVFPIAQFGSVTYLPSTISSVQFFPETGGIKNVIIE